MSDEWQEYLKDTRRICKYGEKCYQKNPDHQKKFKHPPPKQFKGKADINKRNKPRFSPYTRNEAPEKLEKADTDTDNNDISPKNIDANIANSQADDLCSTPANIEAFNKITIDDNTQFVQIDTDNNIFKECFLVNMPPDFFNFYDFLKSEDGSVEKLLSTVNLQLIGPFDLLLGKLPVIDNKDLYLIHWRFYYDPPEFQAILKKKGKSEYHIGYFRDSPDEQPVFLAENNSEKDCSIKPIAKNIFGAVYCYLQQEKKSSPFVAVTCQKLSEKITKWSKEHGYTLEEFNMKTRLTDTVCKSFHGAGIVVPYNKKTQLGYRSLAESDGMFNNNFNYEFIWSKVDFKRTAGNLSNNQNNAQNSSC